MRQRGTVQHLAVQAPSWEMAVHQRDKALVMPSLQQVREFVH
jgi:hypothetical protein